MIYLQLSPNFVNKIYALFPQIFGNEKMTPYFFCFLEIWFKYMYTSYLPLTGKSAAFSRDFLSVHIEPNKVGSLARDITSDQMLLIENQRV